MLTDEQFRKRTQELLAESSKEPYQWYYCSFANEKFLGVVVLQAHGVVECMLRTRSLGANPGGELIAVPFPEDMELPEEKYRNRLLGKEEVLTIWPDTKSIRELEEEENAAEKNI